MRRRVLILFLALMAGVVVVVATVPFWLGTAARIAGRSRGVTFGSYERLGYSRFVVRDIEVRRANVRVTATRAEGDTPVLWLWRHWRERSAPIIAGDWRVEVSRSTTPRNPTAERGWVPLRRLLQRIATQLERWLPAADIGAGVVQWPGGELAIGSAKWRQGELAAKGVAHRTLKGDATIAFARNDLLRVAVQLGDGTATARLESRGARVAGDATWWDQPAKLEATFDPRGWLPPSASLQAQGWALPGDRLKLGQAYATVRGSGRIEWRTDHFEADITATGEPLREKAAPPLAVAIRGRGDARAFTIESLNGTLPGATATLSEPITIERGGKFREGAARFSVQADLVKLPWQFASGTVAGEARLASGVAAAPAIEFSLEARGVSARDVALSEVAARGTFAWPRLQIASGTMVGGEGERLAWRGGWDFRAREILDAAVEGQIRRASLARWLPPQPEFDALRINAQASGPLADAVHRGTLAADGVKQPGIAAVALAAEWHGRGATVEEFKASARAGASRVAAAGSVRDTALTLSTLEFVQGDATRLQLTAPTTLRWRPTFQLDMLRLAGADGNLNATMTAGETGRIEVSARNISSKWFNDFVATPGPELTLTLFALVGAWDKGPMTALLTAGAGLDLGEGRVAAVNFAARGDKDGLRIEALRATEVGETVINATGRLPIVFSPGQPPLMQIDPAGALAVDATVVPNAAFWQKLAAFSGVELRDPRASAHLTGTWRQPEGKVSLQAARIAIDPKRVARPLPAIDSLDIEVNADRDSITLGRCAVRIENQLVRAEGRLPVAAGQWSQLLRQPLAAARQGADLRLEIPDADVAVFTRFLPAVLAPKGRIEADVFYRRGGIEGFLRLRDAASRPLGPLGVLQEINADIALTGRRLSLRQVTAKSGGQPVTLTGTIEMPEQGTPRFDLALKGENLPFVRQTGLLVRGDLDLKLQTAGEAQPRLSGNVRLRDSLFLSDVRAFLPKGGAANPARRPPYFSIETAPVNAWTIAVEVSGEKFMRLRTPVFGGVASAQFRLGGTLGEPRAVGEITIDEGNVRMPFANFAVTQGAVRLTEADPYEPAVYLRGTTRRYGFDLTMEIDGNASHPNVVFTSSPALDSEQVLLMVMTGAVPSNELNKSATQRAASIGYFLGQSLLGSLGADSGDADRLSIASGEKISIQGKETYELEYKLSERWSLTGEYNEFDEYNAGVKWRVLRAKRPEDTDDVATK